METQKILTRDFVLNFFAQFAFSSVFSILIPAIPIYLSKSGTNNAEIGILVGIFSVSSLIARPFVGRALSKIPEKKFMTAGAVIYALSSIAYLFTRPFLPFFLLRAFQGLGMAFFATASVTLATRIGPEEHRGRSIGYFFLSYNLAFALAPSFGMFLINLFDFTVLFLSCAGFSLCSLLITLKLGEIRHVPLDRKPVRERLYLSREALPPSIISFTASFIWGALCAFFPLFALNHGVTNPGLFFAAIAIILILGRILGGQVFDIYPRERVILPCLVAQIIAMIVLVFSTTFSMFILVALIWGIGHAFLFPSLMAYALDHSGTSSGPAVGTYTALSDLGTGLGSVIMGVVLQLTSYPIMFLCLALTGIFNLLYFYFFVRKKGGDRHAHL